MTNPALKMPATPGRITATLVLAKRVLLRIAKQPATLVDVTVQPLVLVLLFTEVFGSAIQLPGGNYHSYLVAGMFATTMLSALPGTASGLSTDLASGLVDRFTTLPIPRSAVLLGRTLADLATNIIGLVVVASCGLLVGWRAHTSPVRAALAVTLILLFGFAMSWVGALVACLVHDAEANQQIGFIAYLGIAFLSNGFVPTDGMPKILRAIADWNPLSATATAARRLLGDPDPTTSSTAWSAHHPVILASVWPLLILAITIPIATRAYRRITRR